MKTIAPTSRFWAEFVLPTFLSEEQIPMTMMAVEKDIEVVLAQLVNLPMVRFRDIIIKAKEADEKGTATIAFNRVLDDFESYKQTPTTISFDTAGANPVHMPPTAPTAPTAPRMDNFHTGGVDAPKTVYLDIEQPSSSSSL